MKNIIVALAVLMSALVLTACEEAAPPTTPSSPASGGSGGGTGGSADGNSGGGSGSGSGEQPAATPDPEPDPYVAPSFTSSARRFNTRMGIPASWTLPKASGGEGAIRYSFSWDSRLAGVRYSNGRLAGTPSATLSPLAMQDGFTGTYVATDGRGNTARMEITVFVEAGPWDCCTPPENLWGSWYIVNRSGEVERDTKWVFSRSGAAFHFPHSTGPQTIRHNSSDSDGWAYVADYNTWYYGIDDLSKNDRSRFVVAGSRMTWIYRNPEGRVTSFTFKR